MKKEWNKKNVKIREEKQRKYRAKQKAKKQKTKNKLTNKQAKPFGASYKINE